SALSGSGYDIVGDLAELIPRPASQSSLQPASQPADAVLDAAVDAAAALVVNHYRRQHPAARPQRDASAHRGLASRVEATVRPSAWLKRTVRELSSRSRTVRPLRVTAWRAMERRRQGRADE